MQYQVRKKITPEYNRFGYERKIIPMPRNWGVGEAVLITWKPGSRTPRHNHNCDGSALVLSGEVVVVPEGAHKMVRFGPSTWLSEAQAKTHIVGSETGALTLHIYPPGFWMKSFPDEEKDQALLNGDVFSCDEFYEYRMMRTGEIFRRPLQKMLVLHDKFDRNWVSIPLTKQKIDALFKCI